MSLFPELDDERFVGLKARLDSLGANPPQVLLFDGASEVQRMAAARYWAARVNCPEAATDGGPCLRCSVCRQIAEQEHLDVLAYDGRIPNKQDEENPGPVRALTVDNVRELKLRLRDAPHGDGCRVVLLAGLEGNRASAANALLKVLEEPSQDTLFVLMTPQRDQLLPTLVSRSHCVTLPWPDPEEELQGEEHEALVQDVAEFLQSGKRLLLRTQAKTFDVPQAEGILSLFEKSLLRVLSGRPKETGVDRKLCGLSQDRLAALSAWTGEARSLLSRQVAAGRVMEGFMMRVFVLVNSR